MNIAELPPGWGKKVRFAFVINCLQSFLIIPVFFIVGLVFTLIITSDNSSSHANAVAYSTPVITTSPFPVILLTILSVLIPVYTIVVLFIGRSGVEKDLVNLDKMRKTKTLLKWILLLPIVPTVMFVIFIIFKQDYGMLFIFPLLTCSTSVFNYAFASNCVKSSMDTTALWTRYDKMERLRQNNPRAQWEQKQRDNSEQWQLQQKREWEQRNNIPPQN